MAGDQFKDETEVEGEISGEGPFMEAEDEAEERRPGLFDFLAIPIPENALATIGDMQEVIALAQRRYQQDMALLAFAISKTSGADWVSLGGKPFPMNRAVMMMVSQTGIAIQITKVETERRSDGHYIKRVYAVGQRVGYAPVAGIGKAFSGTKFYKTRYRKDADGKEVEYEIPASEINEGFVEGHAATNAYYRILCALLGLKGLSWKDLKACNLYPDNAAARITYEGKQAAQGGATEAQKPSGKTSPASPPSKPSQPTTGTKNGASEEELCTKCGAALVVKKKQDGTRYLACPAWKPDNAGCPGTYKAITPENDPKEKKLRSDLRQAITAIGAVRWSMGDTDIFSEIGQMFNRQINSWDEIKTPELEAYHKEIASKN
jgi:hypothetical protein